MDTGSHTQIMFQIHNQKEYLVALGLDKRKREEGREGGDGRFEIREIEEEIRLFLFRSFALVLVRPGL